MIVTMNPPVSWIYPNTNYFKKLQNEKHQKYATGFNVSNDA
jgi:hypothetical protein